MISSDCRLINAASFDQASGIFCIWGPGGEGGINGMRGICHRLMFEGHN